jgi:ligand-binding sensor domain-containing protein
MIHRLHFMLLLMAVPAIQAQTGSRESFVVTHWSMEQGLPQSSVNDILQTRDGYIWLATFGGLVRFDGVSFVTFDRFNTECMRSDRILRLFEDSSARLWASTEDGLLEFIGSSCQLHGFNEVAKSASALVVRQDGQGRVWASVYDTPYRLVNDKFVAVTVEIDPVLVAKAVVDSNSIWMAYSSKLLRTLGDRIVQAITAMPATNDATRLERVRSAAYLIVSSPAGAIQK